MQFKVRWFYSFCDMVYLTEFHLTKEYKVKLKRLLTFE